MKERRNMWEIRQAAENVPEIYIYGDVEEDGYNWRTDEVIRSETSANSFREELAKYADAAEIKLYINSNGGSVMEGTAIYNQLKRHPAKKTVYIDGFACSIASVIAMAGDEIIMPKNALMMIHNMWMFSCGNPAELRKAADDLEIINTAGKQAYLQKMGDRADEALLSRMMDEETWLTAEDCIQYGLADRFAEADADPAKVAGVMQRANLNIRQRIEMQKSLAAQLRQLTQPPAENNKDTLEPKQENEPNGIMAMLNGFFHAEK